MSVCQNALMSSCIARTAPTWIVRRASVSTVCESATTKMRLPPRSIPTAVRQTYGDGPGYACPHVEPSLSAVLAFPFHTIGGQLWRAQAKRLLATAPPCQSRMLIAPLRYWTSVASPGLSGSFSRPPIEEPLPLYAYVKPELNAASRRQRCPVGTSIGPRTAAFGGSDRPG